MSKNIMTSDQRRIADLQGRIYRKQVVIGGLQSDNATKDERIKELEAELTKLRKEYNDLLEKVSIMEVKE